MQSKGMALAFALTLPALIACTGTVQADSFEDASIRLERNVTDDDAEVVMEVKTEEGGLATLLVIAPNGKRIARFDAPQKRALGAREILLESPEPRPEMVLNNYPEGTYRFIGVTFEGEELRATADLSHDFPEAAEITFPAAGATVPATGLVLRWDPVDGAEGYFIELENEELELEMAIFLPGSATSFSPPAGWLVPGGEYAFGVGSIGENGNRTFVETTFTVAR